MSDHRRADIEVSQDANTVALKVPGGATTLTADEAQELAARVFEAAARAKGDPDDDATRLPMQYLRVAAERLEITEEGDEAAPPDGAGEGTGEDEPEGDFAEVHCWIRDQTRTNALHLAYGCIVANGWFVTEILEHETVTRDDFTDGEYLEFYDQALAESDKFLFEIEDED
ncbi:MAG: hypothetical protein K2V38_11340, partial [Gemmataceae bacterium]|nr:hypothetical protein [Gemmataceae bacterium]